MPFRSSIDKKKHEDGVKFCACVFINIKYTKSIGYLQKKNSSDDNNVLLLYFEILYIVQQW
jgi:hypothetical protein